MLHYGEQVHGSITGSVRSLGELELVRHGRHRGACRGFKRADRRVGGTTRRVRCPDRRKLKAYRRGHNTNVGKD